MSVKRQSRPSHGSDTRSSPSVCCYQNASKNSSLELASMNNKRWTKKSKSWLNIRRQRDQKQAIELEFEQLKGELNVNKHMGSDGDAEIVKEVEEIYKGLTEKEEELADLDKFNQTLILRERRTNYPTDPIRTGLLYALKLNINVEMKSNTQNGTEQSSNPPTRWQHQINFEEPKQ
ncbi:hypothetical protein F2Q69_00004134 [Brassica cretica]|uniref:Uncharacterized protein n=1 Tax=Brassica cretica TaxID=69181 RepID=A0A8S9P378_BRACR|nr:hypothetical protein F2Q69_00004134 [Brassica cretica]